MWPRDFFFLCILSMNRSEVPKPYNIAETVDLKLVSERAIVVKTFPLFLGVLASYIKKYGVSHPDTLYFLV